MENEFGELTEEQLDNALGGTDFYHTVDKILEHPELYRPDVYDNIKDEYEHLNRDDSDLDTGRGR